MARIILIPQTDKNYDPSKFEISVEKLHEHDGSYKFYKKISAKQKSYA